MCLALSRTAHRLVQLADTLSRLAVVAEDLRRVGNLLLAVVRAELRLLPGRYPAADVSACFSYRRGCDSSHG